jgi:ribosomal protein S18 acetylase RimI-like enzyme
LSETIGLRRAAESDLAAIIDLRIRFERITRDSGSFAEGERRAELSALLGPDLASSRLLCWLAEEGGRAIASAGLRFRDGEGEMLNVYTMASYRGRGIGSALVGAAIAEARERGLRRLRLQATEDSRRIYERAGFRAAGRGMILPL